MIKKLYVIYNEIFNDEDKDIILNFNAINKDEYINKIYEIESKYTIIDYNDFVSKHQNLKMEELENIIKEMNNKRIHINMIFDKDAIYEDYKYVDYFLNNK